MSLTAVALALCCFQSPQIPSPSPATHEDVIELKNGGQLTGKIIKETSTYIEIQMDKSTVVGFEKKKVAQITRAVSEQSAPVALPELEERDQWYLLHDGEGNAVGKMHGTVVITEAGEVRLGEEWAFTHENGKTEITVLEVLDRELRPISCFYHERGLQAKSDRLGKERLVSAKVEGGRLQVERRTMQDHVKKNYPFRKGMSFPLSHLEILRQRPELVEDEFTKTLFDPKSEEFVRYTVTARSRREVEWGGRPMQVREITTNTRHGNNAEWLDASAQTLRREVNGPSLVATPVSAQAVPRDHAPALVADAGESFALWLPNPSWNRVSVKEGEVHIAAKVQSASAVLMRLDQLIEGEDLEIAADAMMRWLRLTYGQDIKLRRRERVMLRQQEAIRMLTIHTVSRPGESVDYSSELFVFQVDGQLMALCCTSPKERFAELAMDFRRIVDSVEMRKSDFAPPGHENSGKAR